MKNKNQKTLVAAVAMFALIATLAFVTTSLAQQAFSQVVNEGIVEDDNTTNISTTTTKVKSDANCDLSGAHHTCDNESEGEIEVEEE
jgi:hypothetical protein